MASSWPTADRDGSRVSGRIPPCGIYPLYEPDVPDIHLACTRPSAVQVIAITYRAAARIGAPPGLPSDGSEVGFALVERDAECAVGHGGIGEHRHRVPGDLGAFVRLCVVRGAGGWSSASAWKNRPTRMSVSLLRQWTVAA